MLATKSIRTAGYKTILLQNENGPCPLIAIANTLVLNDSPLAAVLADKKEVSLHIIGTGLASLLDEAQLEGFMTLFPSLFTGLDIDPRFNGGFSESPESKLFESFGLTLVHGWILSSLDTCLDSGQESELLASAAQLSYDEYSLARFEPTSQTKLLDEFMAQCPGQLSEAGIIYLQKVLKQDEPAVLFRNNHFATVILHNDVLYTLVTDQGFANGPVWESLAGTSGTGELCDGGFRPIGPIDTTHDEEIARRLAAEEEKAAKEARQAQQARVGRQV